jgi:hypothetical protein
MSDQSHYSYIKLLHTYFLYFSPKVRNSLASIFLVEAGRGAELIFFKNYMHEIEKLILLLL